MHISCASLYLCAHTEKHTHAYRQAPTHTDASHEIHIDTHTHTDTPHTDTPHTDTHTDTPHTDTHTDTHNVHTQHETHIYTGTHTDTRIDTHAHDIQTHKHNIHTDTDRQTQTDRHTHTHRYTDTQKHGRCKKFHHPWKGPFIVMDKLGNTTYKIKPIHNGGRWQFVHFDRLKPCTRTMEEVDLHSPEEWAGERLPSKKILLKILTKILVKISLRSCCKIL